MEYKSRFKPEKKKKKAKLVLERVKVEPVVEPVPPPVEIKINENFVGEDVELEDINNSDESQELQ